MFRKKENPQLEELKLAGEKTGYHCSELIHNTRHLLDQLRYNVANNVTSQPNYEIPELDDLASCLELRNKLNSSFDLFQPKPRKNLSSTELFLTIESNSDFMEPKPVYSSQDLFHASAANGSCNFWKQHWRGVPHEWIGIVNSNDEYIPCHDVKTSLDEIKKSMKY